MLELLPPTDPYINHFPDEMKNDQNVRQNQR